MVEPLIRRLALVVALVAACGPGTVTEVRTTGQAQEDVQASIEDIQAHPSSTTTTQATTTTVVAREGLVARTPSPPTTRPSPTTTTPPPPTTAPPSGGTFTLDEGDDFDRLAACESMGDTNRSDGLTIKPTALSQRTNPKGLYRGAFQYDGGTAEEAGFQGDPVTYSYADQKRLTVAFQRRVGWGRWPHCRRVLGLR